MAGYEDVIQKILLKVHSEGGDKAVADLEKKLNKLKTVQGKLNLVAKENYKIQDRINRLAKEKIGHEKSISAQQKIRGKRLALIKKKNDEIVASTKKTGANIGLAFKQAMNLNKMFSRMAFVTTALISYKLLDLGKTIVRDLIGNTIKWEAEMSKVFTLLDKNEDAFRNILSEDVLKLMKVYGQDLEKSTRAVYDILSARFDPRDVSIISETAAKLAIGEFSDIRVAVDAVTTTLNSFSLSADHAGEAASFLAQMITDGKTTLDELSGSLGTVTSQAGLLGFDMHEIGAAFSTITLQGIKSKVAFTSLRQLMAKLIAPTGKSTELIKKYGLELDIASIQAGGLTKVLEELKGLNERELLVYAGSIRAARALFALINSGALFQEAYSNQINNTNAHLDKFEERADDAALKIKQLKGEIFDLSITMKDDLLPVIKDNLDIWKGTISIIASLTKAYSNLYDGIFKHIDTGLKLAGAWGIVAFAIKLTKIELKGLALLMNLINKENLDAQRDAIALASRDATTRARISTLQKEKSKSDKENRLANIRAAEEAYDLAVITFKKSEQELQDLKDKEAALIRFIEITKENIKNVDKEKEKALIKKAIEDDAIELVKLQKKIKQEIAKLNKEELNLVKSKYAATKAGIDGYKTSFQDLLDAHRKYVATLTDEKEIADALLAVEILRTKEAAKRAKAEADKPPEDKIDLTFWEAYGNTVVSVFNNIAEAANYVFDMMNARIQETLNSDLSRLNKQEAAEIAYAESVGLQTENIQNRFDNRREAARQKAAKDEEDTRKKLKPFMIAEATAEAYLAFNKALASELPPPLNIIFAGSVLALGLAKVAALSGLQFAKGGLVLAKNALAEGGFVSGAGTTTSDSIPAMLSNKEYVVNARATSMYLPLLNAINSMESVTVPKVIGHYAGGGIVGGGFSDDNMVKAIADLGDEIKNMKWELQVSGRQAGELVHTGGKHNKKTRP